MLTGHIRAGLVATFAVMFGIVQLICACIDMPNVDATLQQSHSAHQMNMDVAAHDHHAKMDMAKQDGSSHNHGEHDHDTDCSDCTGTVVLAVAADAVPSVYTAPTVYKTVYVDFASNTRAGMAETNLAGLRWLDPPRVFTSPTPITLHTRSLI